MPSINLSNSEINFWECRESNRGLLGERQECYLYLFLNELAPNNLEQQLVLFKKEFTASGFEPRTFLSLKIPSEQHKCLLSGRRRHPSVRQRGGLHGPVVDRLRRQRSRREHATGQIRSWLAFLVPLLTCWNHFWPDPAARLFIERRLHLSLAKQEFGAFYISHEILKRWKVVFNGDFVKKNHLAGSRFRTNDLPPTLVFMKLPVRPYVTWPPSASSNGGQTSCQYPLRATLA